MGETASFTLDLTGCPHAWQEGWLEAEAMRETTAGWQHVGWLDASQAQPGHQKRRYCLAGPQTIVWNGIATEGAALTDSPDVFTDSVSPFHRALPQVISGEPVPQPYYTIFFRYRGEDSDTAEIIDEASTKIFVPQVVKVEMTDETYEAFCRAVIYPESDWPDVVGSTDLIYTGDPVFYGGCTNMTILQVLGNIVGKCQMHVPAGVNLRFTHDSVNGRCKNAKIVTVEDIHRDVWNALGFAPLEHCSWPNSNPHGVCYVYAKRVRIDSCVQKLYAEVAGFPTQNYDPALFPFSSDDLATALASVAIHETGHTLGLVHQTLYGDGHWHNQTNAFSSASWIMNESAESYMQLFGKSVTPQTWKPRSYEYLRFILPSN